MRHVGTIARLRHMSGSPSQSSCRVLVMKGQRSNMIKKDCLGFRVLLLYKKSVRSLMPVAIRLRNPVLDPADKAGINIQTMTVCVAL